MGNYLVAQSSLGKSIWSFFVLPQDVFVEFIRGLCFSLPGKLEITCDGECLLFSKLDLVLEGLLELLYQSDVDA